MWYACLFLIEMFQYLWTMNVTDGSMYLLREHLMRVMLYYMGLPYFKIYFLEVKF